MRGPGLNGMLPESAHAIARAVSEKRAAAREIVQRSLQRIRERDADVRSCVEVFEEEALATANLVDRSRSDSREKPLLGVPIVVKEVLAVRGARNTWGCPALQGRRAERDDHHVAHLRDTGAIVIATTNVPELSCWGHTENPIYGETANPHDLSRTPGGSSGGSAAAVALGIAPIGIGSDAGGSIRIPASFCGVIGFKPSFWATPADATAEVNRLNVVGPLGLTPSDVELCARILGRGRIGRCRSLEGVRIASTEDYGFAPVAAQVRDSFRMALDALATHGWNVEPAQPPAENPLNFIIPVLECELYESFAEILEAGVHGLSSATVAVAEIGKSTSGREYFRCLARRAEFEHSWRRFFKTYDLLLAPTTQVTAFELGQSGPAAIDGTPIDPSGDGSWYPTSFIANVIGAPAISLPCGWAKDGLPVGLQVMGRPGDDGLVLRAADRISHSLSQPPDLG